MNRKILNPNPQEKKLKKVSEKIIEKDLVEQLEEEENQLIEEHEKTEKTTKKDKKD